MISDSTTSLTGIHLMAKPVGALCNLDCGYCFYLEKESLYPPRHRFRMRDDVLEAYVRRYIASVHAPLVEFTWQGGEPTLIGLDFFERAVALQRLHAGGKRIANTLQTNGNELIDDRWGAFLAREKFLVGVSLDGPRELNDVARPDKQGRSSYDDVLRGMAVLARHGVDFNVLVTVSSANVDHPLEIYRHPRRPSARSSSSSTRSSSASRWRPRPSAACTSPRRRHSARPACRRGRPPWCATRPRARASHTVPSEAYGDFLNAVFDEWVRTDVGNVHVMNFEWALASWCQLAPSACIFSPRCGKAGIVEHDGSVYSCDHFMYPEYKLGNIATDDPAKLMDSPAQRAFGAAKETTLPGDCLRCDFRFACNGECPKNRFLSTADGEPGLNYLCAGYKKYFNHITPAMNRMAALLAAGRSAAEVMRPH